MENTIKQLIRLNIEIEGLLHVLARRDDDDIRHLLSEKYAVYSETFRQLMSSEPSAQVNDEATASVIDINEGMVSDVNMSDVDTADDDATRILNESTPAVEAIPTIETAPAEESDVVEAVTVETAIYIDSADRQSSEETEDACAVEVISPVTEAQDYLMTVEQDEEEKKEEEPEDVATSPEPVTEYIETRDAVSEETEIPYDAVEESPALTIDDTPEKTLGMEGGELRVDELLSRREARDLKRAFTLNDKFRFRRSLFGNNDSLFADTLNTLMAMHDIEEASDYLFNDMGWNHDDEDVKDFVSIVKNHFEGLK